MGYIYTLLYSCSNTSLQWANAVLYICHYCQYLKIFVEVMECSSVECRFSEVDPELEQRESFIVSVNNYSTRKVAMISTGSTFLNQRKGTNWQHGKQQELNCYYQKMLG